MTKPKAEQMGNRVLSVAFSSLFTPQNLIAEQEGI
jgi:hypothetical protein